MQLGFEENTHNIQTLLAFTLRMKSSCIPGRLWKSTYTTGGNVYDLDANVVDMCGTLVKRAGPNFVEHMRGEVDSRTLQPFGDNLQQELHNLDVSQLLVCGIYHHI